MAVLYEPTVLLESAVAPMAVLQPPVSLQNKSIKTDGRIIVAGGVVVERRALIAVLSMPAVLKKSAINRWPCCRRR